MSSTGDRIPTLRKRQCTEADPSLGALRASKRQKPSVKLHSAEFYNSLSKIWLTRRALRELDRRTRQVNNPQHLTPATRLEYREPAKNIQRFARHGGPDLRDLQGYSANVELAPAMSSRHASRSSGSRHTKSTLPTSASSKTRRSSAYDKDFEQHLIDHAIYPEGYNYGSRRSTPEPTLNGFHERLARPRPSLSPSQFSSTHFKEFKQRNTRAISEGKVMSSVIPVITGNADIPNEENLQFTRLNSLTSGVTVDPKPDFYDGARLEDIDATVQADLGPYIIPTGHATAPVAPNFFLEAKSPQGGADVLKRQACYNGAVGARAMNELQSYRQDQPIYDGEAYTISTTYHDGYLKMYATHPTQDEHRTAYHMTQVNTWGLTGNTNSFREGATAFRNARDWAQEQRDALISAANDRARTHNAEPSSSASSDDVLALANVEDPAVDYQCDASQAQETTVFDDGSACNLYNIEHAAYSFSESTTFDSSIHNSYSECHAQESETSADELALNIHTTPKTSSKRRKKVSQRHSSKAPRCDSEKSSRHH